MIPTGYAALRAGGGVGVCRADCVDALGTSIGEATLHAWAAARAERRALQGRAIAYAVEVPGCGAVVVRHSAHGGLLAPLTRDLFLAPTRAPHELATSLALRSAGVRTPEVVAWLAYPAGPLLRRADVATRLVAGGRDLAEVLADPSTARGVDAPWVRATRELLRSLAHAGARHPDLNLKNVLLAPRPDVYDTLDAWVLDIDVVVLQRDGDAAARANWQRLARSLEKWRRMRRLVLRDDELRALQTFA